jgi:ATP-binding cassette subfamily F protein uup
MNLITMENISKAYGEKVLFENISLSIAEGEKIGMLGVNGTGKSSFLKLVAGRDLPDQGKITTVSRLRREMLDQNPDFNPQVSVLEQVFRGEDKAMQVVKRYSAVLDALEKAPADPHLQKEMMELSQQMDVLQAWELESEAKAILGKLGIPNFDAKMGQLSGGQKKRVALASALMNPAQLLILDEPSNHIDMQAIEWLEQVLKKYSGAVLMVTHDRYFLERVATRIIELDHGQIYSYSGNYSQFLELKLQREADQRASERKRQSILRTELAWIQRGARARSTKQKARIERFEELQGQRPPQTQETVQLASCSSRLGKKVIELQDLQ